MFSIRIRVEEKHRAVRAADDGAPRHPFRVSVPEAHIGSAIVTIRDAVGQRRAADGAVDVHVVPARGWERVHQHVHLGRAFDVAERQHGARLPIREMLLRSSIAPELVRSARTFEDLLILAVRLDHLQVKHRVRRTAPRRVPVVHTWYHLVIVLSVLQRRQGDLLYIGQAARLTRLLASLGKDREENCCQYGDDGNHHQQLNEGETALRGHFDHLL